MLHKKVHLERKNTSSKNSCRAMSGTIMLVPKHRPNLAHAGTTQLGKRLFQITTEPKKKNLSSSLEAC